MVRIREMTTADYKDSYELWESVPGMGLQTLDNSLQAIKKMIIKNPGLCLVAEINDQIVGTALGVTDGRKGYLYHVAVAPEYQGEHISSELLAKVKAGFAQQGIQKIGLFVVKGNSQGESFWKHQGFAKRKDIEYLDLNI